MATKQQIQELAECGARIAGVDSKEPTVLLRTSLEKTPYMLYMSVETVTQIKKELALKAMLGENLSKAESLMYWYLRDNNCI